MKIALRWPRLLQEWVGVSDSKFSGRGMAIVAVARALNVGRNLAIMTPEKNLAWARLGSVANKALNELAYRRGGDQSRVCNDGGFDSAQRRTISFVPASVKAVLREAFAAGLAEGR